MKTEIKRFFFPPRKYDGHEDDDYVQIRWLLDTLQQAKPGDKHERALQDLRDFCIAHQDDLLEVLKSPTLSSKEAKTLLWIGRHVTMAAVSHNLSWFPFLQKVWFERDSMPDVVVSELEWWFPVNSPGFPENFSPTEYCELLLSEVILAYGEFNREKTLLRLLWMKNRGELSTQEYMNLVDATNNFAKDGHFKSSMVYRRAEMQELDSTN